MLHHCRVTSCAHPHSTAGPSFPLPATLLNHQIGSISVHIPVQKPEHNWARW